ncbi:endo-1,4-beta-xylanase [Planotetraspora sp. GP83]|uniref:endo-1,4-beta-xylanase n=1 Tax=Planotetraspora sp. GP83 TaxID=3156264 RepID=UPI003511EE66
MKLRAAGLALLTLTAVVSLAGPAAAADDLIAGHDWSHFAGAKVQPDGVRITPLDRRIVDVNGTGGQADPPVNLRGPRLKADGDFRVTAVMDGVGDKGAYLQLYGGVPIIYDEWRQEPASLRLGVKGGKLTVSLWNGGSDKPATTKSYGSGLSGRVTVEVRGVGQTFSFYANGAKVGTLGNPGIFKGLIWFGADAEVGGGWTLVSLTAQGEGGDNLTVADAPALAQPVLADSLRRRAAALPRPIDIGAALASAPLFADAGYRALAGGQFDMLTPENDFKPQFVQPRKGVFTFEDGDALVAFAQANGMKVHAHTLVWHEALPAWMRQNATKQTMFDHIDAVAGHFKGKVAEWDVVNEPMSDEDADYTNGHQGLRPESPWFKSMGEQYIDLAFQRAHQVDPGAKLFLNEYGAEANGERWDALYNLVKRLKQRGVPIDGVGFQNHEYEAGDRVPAETFRAHVKKLAALGVEVRVSEMDVLVSSSQRKIQADEIAGKLKVCREEPTCTSFTTWGFTDKYGSTADVGSYPPAPGDALPWDSALKPKQAYTAMLNTLG